MPRAPGPCESLRESRLHMATIPIRAVLFDMGGTLEELYSDEAIRLEATRGLRELLRRRGADPGLGLQDLQATVSAGLATYHTWRAQTEMELPAGKVWTEFIFVNHDQIRDRLLAVAEDLSFFHEAHSHTRSLRPEAPTLRP